MKFEKAAKLMKEGKKITDKAWDGCNHIYSDGNRIFDKFGKEYALSLINLESTSWEEYVEPKKTLSNKMYVLDLDKPGVIIETNEDSGLLRSSDVKESIKLLKERIKADPNHQHRCIRVIDEIFGEELTR